MKRYHRVFEILVLVNTIALVAGNCELFSLECFDWKFKITATEACRLAEYEGINLLGLLNNEQMTSECRFQD